MMYEKLVKQLQYCATHDCMHEAEEIFGCTAPLEDREGITTCNDALMLQAADAIEELSKRVPPVPHGRLIDADALIADIKRQCREVFRVDAVSPDDFWITRNEAYNERLWGTWCESFFGYLQTRPTIIEAEEGEE